jgi:hypothetical protein
VIETAPEREQRVVLRGLMFFVALIAIPAGLYGVIAQHAIGAAVAVLGGLVCLIVWWLTRRRFAGAQARRLNAGCSLLSVVAGAGVVLAVVLFLASPAYGASLSTLMPAIIALGVTVVLLAARLAAGHRLKTVAAAEIAAAGPMRPAMASTGPHMPGLQTDTLTIAEMAGLRQRLESGQYQSTPGLTVQPGGTLVLRPKRLRVKGWHRGSAAALPFALILLARTFLTTGWIGLLAVAAGVALILLVILSLYEVRVRQGAAILTSTKLIVPTWYGRRRSVPRPMVARVALVRAHQQRGNSTPLLLAVASNGRCLLALNAGSIAGEDTQAFAAALQVPVDVRNDRQELAQLSQDYPGSVPWAWSHPAVLGLLIALVIVVIVVGVVVGLAAGGVISSSSGQPG